VDLVETLRRAVSSLDSQAVRKRIELTTTLPESACVIEGDAFLLEKAVLNLLQNALAYAPEGGRISVQRRREKTHGSAEGAG
jgi:signal transduction histidine kinase